MLFNSVEFLLFFVTVTILYYALPQRWRYVLLLTASCYFYMWFIPVYILILALTIVVDYFAAIWIEKTEGKRRKHYLIISIISTCAILFVFKYFNFFNTNIANVAKALDLNYPYSFLYVILPIGLSLHTFQSLSYVIEVYRGNQKAEKHFGIYALYVMFYPQLVAGPIERPQNLLHQFHEKHNLDFTLLKSGLRLMLWGYFKKVVIADRLSLYVNEVYNHPLQYHGFTVILATYFFAFQIYCDFSGYSDIAIGAARVMGFKLMTNFNKPYFSRSVSEFWKRWHISLSTWFRDYLYIPLGGNRVGKWRWYYNLFITFVISGLWHGANWTFIIWGAINGSYLIFEIITHKQRLNFANQFGRFGLHWFYQFCSLIITFNLICLAWVFFRANSLSAAWLELKNMTHIHGSRIGVISQNEIFLCFLSVVFLLIAEFFDLKTKAAMRLANSPLPVRWAAYALLLFTILAFGVFSKESFIYFQF